MNPSIDVTIEIQRQNSGITGFLLSMPLPPLLLPLLPPFTKLDRILESLFIHCKGLIKYTSNRFTFSGMKRERKKRERGRKIHCLFYVSVLFHCKMIHSLQRIDQIYIKSIHIFSVSFRRQNNHKQGYSGLDVNGYGYLQQPQRLTTHQLATKNSIIINVINFEDIFANDVENKDEIDFHEKT